MLIKGYHADIDPEIGQIALSSLHESTPVGLNMTGCMIVAYIDHAFQVSGRLLVSLTPFYLANDYDLR